MKSKIYALVFLLSLSIPTKLLSQSIINANATTNKSAYYKRFLDSEIIVNFGIINPNANTYTAKLMLEGQVIKSKSISTSPFNIIITYDDNKLNPSSDNYYIEIYNNGQLISKSNNFTIGWITSVYCTKKNTYDICDGSTTLLQIKTDDNWDKENDIKLNYRWYFNGNEIVDNKSKPLLATTPGQYKVQILDEFDKPFDIFDVSNSYNLITNTSIFNSVNISGNDFVCNGSEKKIESTYNTTTAQYNWFKNGEIIPNSNSSIYKATESGIYSVAVTDMQCPTRQSSNHIALSFSNSLFAKIIISDTVLCGEDYAYISLIDNVFERNQYQIQWLKDGQNFDSNSRYKFRLNTNLPGIYKCKITQGNCTTYSNEIKIIPSTKAQKPKLKLINKLSFFNTQGQNCMKSAYLEGELSGKSYMLYKDDIYTNRNFYNGYTTTEPGVYTIKTGSGSCEVSSDPITVSFDEPYEPDLFSNTREYVCGLGGINSSGVFLHFGNLNLPSNINTTWQTTIPTENYAGSGISIFANLENIYRVKFQSNDCIGYSKQKQVMVKQTPTDVKLLASNYTDNCDNGLVKITIPEYSNEYNPIRTYNWYKNGQLLENTNGPNLYVNGSGSYTCKFISTNCIATSSPINISKREVPSVPVGQTKYFYSPGNVSFNTQGCNGILNWFDSFSGGQILNTGNNFITPNLNMKTTYFTECNGTNDCISINRNQMIADICNSGTTIGSGSWNDPLIWKCGIVPNSTIPIEIKQNHIITISNENLEIKSLNNNGNLILNENTNLIIKK